MYKKKIDKLLDNREIWGYPEKCKEKSQQQDKRKIWTGINRDLLHGIKKVDNNSFFLITNSIKDNDRNESKEKFNEIQLNRLLKLTSLMQTDVSTDGGLFISLLALIISIASLSIKLNEGQESVIFWATIIINIIYIFSFYIIYRREFNKNNKLEYIQIAIREKLKEKSKKS